MSIRETICVNLHLIVVYPVDSIIPGRGGGDYAYERGGDARRKLWIKPLRKTVLGVAQAFFDP